uniref:Uncharacterized protein n=1 Tax=Aegilops tauschii subsp. strangulata TaxID=200361 RepID=A0A453A399_AEGTS
KSTVPVQVLLVSSRFHPPPFAGISPPPPSFHPSSPRRSSRLRPNPSLPPVHQFPSSCLERLYCLRALARPPRRRRAVEEQEAIFARAVDFIRQPVRIRMASSTLKPGVPVTLQELAPSSEMFKQGASLRVTGILQSYDVDSAVAVIRDGSATMKIDTQHLRDISFRSGSIFQFIGELLIRPNDDAILQARNVDGLDLNLYQQSLIIRRQHEARLLSSRSA